MNIIAETKFATFSNCVFIMDYSLNIDSKLDRSVEGLLVYICTEQFYLILRSQMRDLINS